MCCVCRTPHKDVQLHHIDGDPNHQALSNLGVVCLDCHSRVTGDAGLGRQYSAGEVQKYKKTWEQIVAIQRKSYRPPSVRVQRELIGHVDVIVCQILASPSHARRRELLDVLYNMYLWRGTPRITKQIIEGLGHLAVMSGLSMPRLAKEVAIQVWQLCWHFVGPHQVKMDKSDEKWVIKCVDVVETVVDFNCLMEQDVPALRTGLDTAESLFDLSLWYKRQSIAKAVLKVYSESLRSCGVGRAVDFPSGVKALRLSAKKLLQKLRDSKLKYPSVERELRHLATP